MVAVLFHIDALHSITTWYYIVSPRYKASESRVRCIHLASLFLHAQSVLLASFQQTCEACLHTMLPGSVAKVVWALCGHETPAGQAQGGPAEGMQCESPPGPQEAAHRPASPHKPESDCTNGSYASIRVAANSCMSNTAACAEPSPTVIQLSRDERIVFGQKCKQLIDAGREDWLLQQGSQTGSVCCCCHCSKMHDSSVLRV